MDLVKLTCAIKACWDIQLPLGSNLANGWRENIHLPHLLSSCLITCKTRILELPQGKVSSEHSQNQETRNWLRSIPHSLQESCALAIYAVSKARIWVRTWFAAETLITIRPIFRFRRFEDNVCVVLCGSISFGSRPLHEEYLCFRSYDRRCPTVRSALIVVDACPSSCTEAEQWIILIAGGDEVNFGDTRRRNSKSKRNNKV